MWKKRGSKSSIFKRDWLVCYSLKRHGSTCEREQHVTEYSISCFCIEHNLSNKNVVISLIPNVSNIFHDAHNKRHQWPTYDFSSYELIDWFEKIRKEKVCFDKKRKAWEWNECSRHFGFCGLDAPGIRKDEQMLFFRCPFLCLFSPVWIFCNQYKILARCI